MADYLVFRLYGPLAAWGGQAVGEYRPSQAHPSKSGVMGLLAAALGIQRQEEEPLAALALGYGLAVRMDNVGVLLRDYHTIQVPGEKRGVIHRTRRNELAGPKDTLNTILSTRDYHADTLVTVCLWARDNAPHPLSKLAEALKAPVFTPYLGRKSCVTALPMHPQLVAADDFALAFAQASWQPAEEKLLRALLGWTKEEAQSKSRQALFYWDADGLHGGLKLIQHTEPHDQLASRKRWQFAQRREVMGNRPAANKP